MERPSDLTDTERNELLAEGYRPVERWVRPDEGSRMDAILAEMRQIAEAEDAADLDLFLGGNLKDQLRLVDKAEREAGLPSPLDK